MSELDLHDVRIGTQFRSAIADANALWEVTAYMGNDVWRAAVVNEPMEINGEFYDSDYVGTVQVFEGDQIRRTLDFADIFTRKNRESDEFYESLQVGQIVHYHNGFGAFVRCEVVTDGEKRLLKPIALVGEWRDYDLPKRLPNGEVSLPYHPRGIAEGETFQPHATNVYESSVYVRSTDKDLDPTTLEPIDLSVPEPTPEEAEAIRKTQILERIQAVAEVRIGDDLDDALEAIRQILEEA